MFVKWKESGKGSGTLMEHSHDVVESVESGCNVAVDFSVGSKMKVRGNTMRWSIASNLWVTGTVVSWRQPIVQRHAAVGCCAGIHILSFKDDS